MGYKKTDVHLSFADIALFNSLDRNRAIKRMEKISTVINWSKIEPLVVRGYSVGKSAEGGEAYHPLLLLKCRIPRDDPCHCGKLSQAAPAILTLLAQNWENGRGGPSIRRLPRLIDFVMMTESGGQVANRPAFVRGLAARASARRSQGRWQRCGRSN